MSRYVCSICGYIYDEEAGAPEAGIAPRTTWDMLPDDWKCPICGADKDAFERQREDLEQSKPAPSASKAAPSPSKPVPPTSEADHSDMKEMSPLEISALCSNLARGCEKQYKAKEAELFNSLADFFQKATPPAEVADAGELLALIEQDLTEGFPYANSVAAAEGDRGALRALVWSEKVTRILKSLLTRHQKEGDGMLENTGVYVCTICGFVFVGDVPPDICPVCKVPNWKFEKIEGRAQ